MVWDCSHEILTYKPESITFVIFLGCGKRRKRIVKILLSSNFLLFGVLRCCFFHPWHTQHTAPCKPPSNPLPMSNTTTVDDTST